MVDGLPGDRIAMRLTITLALAIASWSVVGATLDFDNARQLYEEFKRKYNKPYVNEDDEYRFNVFKDNLNRAKRYQAMDQGTAEYGITEFSDLTSEEFQTKYLGLKIDAPLEIEEESLDHEELVEAGSFDWRDHGAVGPVLRQGHCGSCWAFSTIGNIEGQWFKKTGRLLQLSEQQLLDCDSVDHGCAGGYPPKTYGVIKKMGGLELDSDYPYRATMGKCIMDRAKFRAYVNGSIAISRNEAIQAQKLREIGPLASALNANMLQFYRRGIMKPFSWLCSPRGLNHAVLTVGYGSENGVPFWTIKNSWGKSFGENGYFRIARGRGTCGINLVVTSAVVK